MVSYFVFSFFFFFNDTATTEIYTLSLHHELPLRLRHRPVPPPGFLHQLGRQGEVLVAESPAALGDPRAVGGRLAEQHGLLALAQVAPGRLAGDLRLAPDAQ